MMKKSFWYNSDQNGDLLKPRTGHGQYVVDIDNMLFAISGLSNCTVSTYRVFLQCTMCTLFSLMPLYLLWPCIRYQGGRSCAGQKPTMVGICHGGNMPVGQQYNDILSYVLCCTPKLPALVQFRYQNFILINICLFYLWQEFHQHYTSNIENFPLWI